MDEVNSLNSILVEGDVATVPVSFTDGGVDMVKYTIATRVDRDISIGDNQFSRHREMVYSTVYAKGRLGESCLRELKLDTHIRVLGILTQMWTSELSILAEHVEFPHRYAKK